MWIARLVFLVSVALGAVIGVAGPAGAHPLGNFTTNRYARIEVGASVVRVHYVLDEAELVAFRERDRLAVEGVNSYRDRRVRELRDGLQLTIDGSIVPLRVVTSTLVQPEGQAGLSTLRIDAVLEAPLVGGQRRTEVAFEDTNGASLIGWREIVVSATAGARLDDRASLPTAESSDRLRRYPTDPAVAPLDRRSVQFHFTPGTGVDRPATVELPGAAPVASDRFANLLSSTASSPVGVAGALMAAFAFGIVHALGPGHGKTVMAAYLVSTEGRRRDAFLVGGVVSLMHTASVLALAAALATIGSRLNAARLYPALTLVSGVLVVGVGLRLLAHRWGTRPRRAVIGHHGHTHHPHDHDSTDAEHTHAPRDHSHDSDLGVGADVHIEGATVPPPGGGRVAVLARQAHAGTHGHGHGHDHGPAGHTHELPPEIRPLSRAGILALGAGGGLFPSPSAVVVLVGAFALGRAALGLALIAAFSVGLASMLVGVGLVLVAGRDRLQQSRFALHLPWLPVAGAAAIVVLGAALVAQAAAQVS